MRNTNFIKSSNQSNFKGQGRFGPCSVREIVQNLKLNRLHFKTFDAERNTKIT